MQRRDFFKSVMRMPLKRLSTSLRSEELSETDLFMEAMRFGIDPATLSPAELRKTVNQKRQEVTPKSQPEGQAAPS